jgi:predicted transcriptional regulator of viral defense system
LPEGWTRHRLERLVEAGEYERVAAGVFVRSEALADTSATWIGIAVKRPEATLCLLSAAAMHDLTDEIPRATNLAIPRGLHPVSVDWPPVRWHRFAVDTFVIGRAEHPLAEGISIGLYSAERTIIDLFRLRHEWGQDMAIEALKRWLRGQGHAPSTLLDLARSFPDALTTLRESLEILL